MIPDGFIQDLLNRLDIVDVVARYLPLKKAGANYVACCPFHNEKTPSFTVSAAKQFYHCFGCGAHGTAIRFVMEHSGMGFVEAVKELAASVGAQVPQLQQRKTRSENAGPDLSEILLTALHYYRDELKRSETAVSYLKSRGLNGEIATRFGIGYAPDGWQNLASAFSDYQAPELVKAGLVVEGEGKRYDRFRGRIMFPIQNQRGAVIGFGGRVIGEGEPKYLNSPETPVFEKGRELYGLPQARKTIHEAGLALVVEGYMDVVALHQQGIAYAVATLGTATTPIQVQKLLRQTDNIYFCFDGDEAGRRAAWRALENSLAQLVDGKNLAFLFLPEGQDPDSFVREHGRQEFERLLKEALPLSVLLLRELTAKTEPQTEEGRARLLQLAKPLVLQITAPVFGLILRKRLAELAGISQGELDNLYQVKPASRTPGAKAKPREAPSLHKKILQCLISRPDLAQRCDAGLVEATKGAGTTTAVLEFLHANPHVNPAGIIQHFSDTAHEAAIMEASSETMTWGDAFDVEAQFMGGLGQLRELQRKAQEQAQLAKLQKDGATPEVAARLRQLTEQKKAAASK